jgi:hypothetical protein
MRRLLTLMGLTASAVLVPGGVALACEGHSPTATMMLAGHPGLVAGVLAAGLVGGIVRLLRR